MTLTISGTTTVGVSVLPGAGDGGKVTVTPSGFMNNSGGGSAAMLWQTRATYTVCRPHNRRPFPSR